MFATIDPRPMTRQPQLDAKHTTSSQASNRAFAPFRRSAGSLQRSTPHPSSRIAPSAMQCRNTLTPGAWSAVKCINKGTSCQSSAQRKCSVNVRCAAASSAPASGASLSTEVVIVGGGLAGLAAGVALQKAGENECEANLFYINHSTAIVSEPTP